MTYRILEVTEWQSLEAEFAQRNCAMPDPRFAMIVGAFTDSDALAGFLVCQLQFHAEPIMLNDPRALRGLVREMERELIDRVGSCSYFAFSEDSKISGICEAVGMHQMDYLIYQKQLKQTSVE